jgi:hypothetical protein
MVGEWQQKFSKSAQRHYWQNTRTGLKSWKLPDVTGPGSEQSISTYKSSVKSRDKFANDNPALKSAGAFKADADRNPKNLPASDIKLSSLPSGSKPNGSTMSREKFANEFPADKPSGAFKAELAKTLDRNLKNLPASTLKPFSQPTSGESRLHNDEESAASTSSIA